MNSIKQPSARKRRLVQLTLDGECITHIEIISCEREINKLVKLLTKHYCVKEIFVDKKDKE